MNGQSFCPQSSGGGIDKAMHPEQFKQVVDAILAGKYSWACVLILRFAGYNPLHYIPYTTYNRLVKDNCNVKRLNHHQSRASDDEDSNAKPLETVASSPKCLSQLKDLAYLEMLDSKDSQVKGGSFWGIEPIHSCRR